MGDEEELSIEWNMVSLNALLRPLIEPCTDGDGLSVESRDF